MPDAPAPGLPGAPDAADHGNGTPEQRYLEPTGDGGLWWGVLSTGTLLRRYKRFLADVRLDDGTVLTVHTPNTGAMLGCCEPGRRVWFSHHPLRGRKYPHTLEMIDMPAARVGINTGVPNRLVRSAAAAGVIPCLPHPSVIRSEVRYGQSRLDLLLQTEGGPDVFVEVKNCTLVQDGVALFPDAVTVRGLRHLHELAAIADAGQRAVLCIVVQRSDATRFSPADAIDPDWSDGLRRAAAKGVEVCVLRAGLTDSRIDIDSTLPAVL